LKIYDLDDPSVFALSEGTFTVLPKPPSNITVTSPNGGEVFYRDTNRLIKWDSIPSVNNVKIEISPDGGLNYDPIIGSTDNDGEYEWCIGSDLDTGYQHRIRITDIDNTIIFDVSSSGSSTILPTRKATTANPMGQVL